MDAILVMDAHKMELEVLDSFLCFDWVECWFYFEHSETIELRFSFFFCLFIRFKFWGRKKWRTNNSRKKKSVFKSECNWIDDTDVPSTEVWTKSVFLFDLKDWEGLLRFFTYQFVNLGHKGMRPGERHREWMLNQKVYDQFNSSSRHSLIVRFLHSRFGCSSRCYDNFFHDSVGIFPSFDTTISSIRIVYRLNCSHVLLQSNSNNTIRHQHYRLRASVRFFHFVDQFFSVFLCRCLHWPFAVCYMPWPDALWFYRIYV